MGSLAIWIIAIAAAIIVGLWLAFAAAGFVIHLLGYILLIAGVVGIVKLATGSRAR